MGCTPNLVLPQVKNEKIYRRGLTWVISQVGVVGRKHKSTKPLDVKSPPPVSNQGSPVQILNLDSEPKDPPSNKVSSTVHAPTSSLPSKEVPQHLLGNEDMAWERFTTAVTDADVSTYNNMSLKDFEHSGVHDLFKVSYIYIYIYTSHL